MQSASAAKGERHKGCNREGVDRQADRHGYPVHDNGHWQPNYSSIVGNMAAGGISNLYYPSKDRNAAGVVISTAMIRIGEIAVANVFQEFLVPKLTPNLRTRAPSQP